jgi:DNA segregation ATPase FtsK/SpoIIIE-like protein
MGAPRTLAAKLLRAVVRLAPAESRDWAAAMLRELDFVDGDWAALFWALGSAAAILRHAASVWRAWLSSNSKKEAGMNTSGRKALGVGLGMLSALALVGCAFAVLRILGTLFPGLEHSPWAYWLAVLAVPEAIFVVATVMLWRKKGPVAAGILATGLVMALHVAVHLTLHW